MCVFDLLGVTPRLVWKCRKTVMFQELQRPRMRVQNDKSTNGITSYLLDRSQDLVWGPLIKHFPNILGDVCFPLKRSSNHWQLHGFCKKITVFCYRIWRFGLNSWIFPGNIEVHQDTYMGTNIFHFQHIFLKLHKSSVVNNPWGRSIGIYLYITVYIPTNWS